MVFPSLSRCFLSSSFSDLKSFYQQTSPCIFQCFFFYCVFFMETLLSFTQELLKLMINNSDWTIQTCVFAEQNRTIQRCLKLWCILMLTQMLSGMWWLNSTQFASIYWMDMLSLFFFVGAAESITLPLMWTHSVLLFFHVGHAGNKLTVAWLPAPWPSQVNHLALLCNTDHHNHYCVEFTMLL